ncbi:MAG: phasin family protein [Betaproteobacteria bacterium]
MVGKKQDNPATEAADKVRESAQQIWLAGLGAFAKAQQEGGKVFEALVQDGVNLQRKTQAVAQERMAEATERITEMAGGLSAKAGQQWGKLESIFEDRVARALSGLGVPSAQELQLLSQRVQDLEAQVQALQKAGQRPRASRSAAAGKAAAKPAVRRAGATAKKAVRSKAG